MIFRWIRIRAYRRFYSAYMGQSNPTGHYAQSCICKANALWDRMSELDRQFILQTESI